VVGTAVSVEIVGLLTFWGHSVVTRVSGYICVAAGVAGAVAAAPVRAQDLPTGDPVIARIYDEGMHRSQAAALGQVLADSIGPRLTGSAANREANEWLVRTYTAWGIPARNEKYGTWREWTRGPSRLELVEPRSRVLGAMALAWSVNTPDAGSEGDVVMLPPTSEVRDAAGFARWLTTVRGRFVMVSMPEPTCRPDTSWAAWATPASYASMRAARDSARAEWQRREAVGGRNGEPLEQLAKAGVAGILTSTWTGGWGVDRVMSTVSLAVPAFDVSCEDNALLGRLIVHGQHPRIRAVAASRTADAEVPVFNTVAEVRGSAHPDEYVVLSAHLDSWDAGSGATDNGTGTITMLEAMRILRQAYPHPKRTIVAGHWSGEEEGELGSGAFAVDHPEIMRGMEVLLNQDNGTGPIDSIDTNGFLDAPETFARWMARMPADVTAGITIDEPGYAKDEDSDSDAFACRGAPGFFLTSSDYGYTDYTWHTPLDTYDKINFDEVRRNATLIAMLAYEASEDSTRMSRARRVPPTDPKTGRVIDPPACAPVQRSWAAAFKGQ
jgi:carboxypeptidase Q